MGRTVPTFRQLVDDAIARWSKFRRALRREDQEYFDRLFRRVRTYTQAATYQASDNPMEAILLSIALDQEKRLDALERAAPRQVGAALALKDSGRLVLAVLGAAIVLRSFVLDGQCVPRFHARPIGVSLLAIVLFGIALQWLGLVAAVAVLVLVGSYATRDVRPLENLALAAVMIVFSVAVFVWLLGLSLGSSADANAPAYWRGWRRATSMF